jgi:acyl carrier protein phosphodiesterase
MTVSFHPHNFLRIVGTLTSTEWLMIARTQRYIGKSIQGLLRRTRSGMCLSSTQSGLEQLGAHLSTVHCSEIGIQSYTKVFS